MSNSKLVSYTDLSPHCNKPRYHAISKITIHHMAGNLSLETLGKIFKIKKSSANYGIDVKGNIGLYVNESDRAWTSSSKSNDNAAITIEVANDVIGGNWHVSDASLNSLINLCVDICKRNGIDKLVYTGDKNGNVTLHNMFTKTTCPGPYLESKIPYIVDTVNSRLKKEVKTVQIELNVLKKGMKGEQVKTLQRLINAINGTNLAIDGSFGPATLEAVKTYQKRFGLAVDGSVGPATWNSLLK